jgi:hypothetical protein
LDENRCRTGSLTNNANQCRRALVRFVWRVFRFCEISDCGSAKTTGCQAEAPCAETRSADARLRCRCDPSEARDWLARPCSFCQVIFEQITPNSSDIDGSPAC